jgi:basic amino acid/polyamine antiporter, APA family
VFFERLAVIQDRFGTPAVAVVALAAWAGALAVTGTFEQMLTYVVFTAWIFYALGALSVFALRRSEPNAVRSFRGPGYPVTPTLFVIAALLLVLNTLVAQPWRALLGLAVVLFGVPCFYVWRSTNRPRRPRQRTLSRR